MRVSQSTHHNPVQPVDHSAHDAGKLRATAEIDSMSDSQIASQRDSEHLQNKILNHVRDNLESKPVNQHLRTGLGATEKSIQQPGGV